MSASYLDLYIEINNGERLQAKLSGKLDDFTFSIFQHHHSLYR
jgi:hypothetical protein